MGWMWRSAVSIPPCWCSTMIRQVTEVLENAQANIAFMRVFRNAKRKDACMIIETDDPIPPESIRAIQNLKPVIREVCTL